MPECPMCLKEFPLMAGDTAGCAKCLEWTAQNKHAMSAQCRGCGRTAPYMVEGSVCGSCDRKLGDTHAVQAAIAEEMAAPPNPRNPTILAPLTQRQVVSKTTEQIIGRMSAAHQHASQRHSMYGALPARLKVPTSLSHQKKAILVNIPPENSFIVNVTEILVQPRKNNAHFTCVASRYLATEPWKNIEQAIIAALDAQAFKHPLHRCRVTSKSEFLPDSTSGDLQLLVDRHTEGLLKDIHISITDLAKKNLPMKVALWLSDQDEWKGRG
ncbi:hypothetical protein CALCODRAFT_513618, partial [Calocera cornea HHB12733]